MPAAIAHMLISGKTRPRLRLIAEQLNDPHLTAFVDNVLERHRRFMELGSLGPDLPYFGTLSSLRNPNRPLSLDQWSYQLHSKEPNVFPLRMIEITWKESDLTRDDWKEIDDKKFAFLCGFLTHMAADQTIHPLVNAVAGSYEKRRRARKRHRECEVHQDLYILSQEHGGSLRRGQFKRHRLDLWCDPKPRPTPSRPLTAGRLAGYIWQWLKRLLSPPCPRELSYLVQKAFVEAYALKAWPVTIQRWVFGARLTLRLCNHLPRPIGPYLTAHGHLFDKNGTLRTDKKWYKEFIVLKDVEHREYGTYDQYVAAAVELACIYVQAAYKIYVLNALDDPVRNAFEVVVRDADLGSPLETGILKTASDNLAAWDTWLAYYHGLQRPRLAQASAPGRAEP